jgi:hypothetical protein
MSWTITHKLFWAQQHATALSIPIRKTPCSGNQDAISYLSLSLLLDKYGPSVQSLLQGTAELVVLAMFLAKLSSTFIFWHLVSAHPLYQTFQPMARDANSTIPSQNAFMKEPSTRGTIGLIYSCLTTLFLCAWTAVHLNVPPSGSLIRSTTHRLIWMILAAFLPEFVIWRALRQWTAARQLLKIVNTVGPNAAAGMQLVCTIYGLD